MNLNALIQIASDAYPDGLVLQAHQGGNVGDSIAEFIAREIKETYDNSCSPEEKIAQAAQCITNAISELHYVEVALLERLYVEEEINLISRTPKEELPLLINRLGYPDETLPILTARLKS